MPFSPKFLAHLDKMLYIKFISAGLFLGQKQSRNQLEELDTDMKFERVWYTRECYFLETGRSCLVLRKNSFFFFNYFIISIS